MLKKVRIDTLLLFLILSCGFLWFSFPQIQKELLKPTQWVVADFDIEKQLNYEEDANGEISSIRTYNEELTLLYSTNGGATFQEAVNNNIRLNEINNSAIIYKNTSLRWRHPKGEFPNLKTVVVKLRDELKGEESKQKVLTFNSKAITPIINITICEKDLFGWENGIMIYGETSSRDDGFQKDWWYRSANFAERGSKWSRAAHFEYFNSNGDYTAQHCEMKISGNATRYFPQKSFKLFPIAENGKRTKMNYRFFGDNGNKKTTSLLVRQSGNDNGKTMFADLLMHKLAEETKVLTQDGFPISVFINGNYWGVYNFRERYDTYFIAKKEAVKEKEVTILYCEVYGDQTLLKAGDEKEKQAFDSLVQDLPEHGILSEARYEVIADQISIKSFIDYIFFETFYANQDWLHNNTTWYKAADKKWKWLLNDLDYGLAYTGEHNVESNLFNKLKKRQSITANLFTCLISAKIFKDRFKKRANELIKEQLSEKRILNVFNTLKEKYDPIIDLQIRRWRFIDSREEWEKDCQKNVTFLLNRRTIYQKQLDNL